MGINVTGAAAAPAAGAGAEKCSIILRRHRGITRRRRSGRASRNDASRGEAAGRRAHRRLRRHVNVKMSGAENNCAR